ncbi:hypothetical protein KIPB_005956 [Kipferlia bialata]|uniref:Uncharacterized protein n=1 Tax=Kipferlia bialata TaxID=797122 RepID=A0A9K3GIV8_9EUKA|nr:hypothetical protein KIPB_005956 [Kipferlia bialata]|eukprot:g5956.t1
MIASLTNSWTERVSMREEPGAGPPAVLKIRFEGPCQECVSEDVSGSSAASASTAMVLADMNQDRAAMSYFEGFCHPQGTPLATLDCSALSYLYSMLSDSQEMHLHGMTRRVSRLFAMAHADNLRFGPNLSFVSLDGDMQTAVEVSPHRQTLLALLEESYESVTESEWRMAPVPYETVTSMSHHTRGMCKRYRGLNPEGVFLPMPIGPVGPTTTPQATRLVYSPPDAVVSEAYEAELFLDRELRRQVLVSMASGVLERGSRAS